MGILIAGDFVPSGRYLSFKSLDEWSEAFADILPLLHNNYAIVNLEAPCIESHNITFTKIHKVGPSLGSTDLSIRALAGLGFNCVTLANNHFRDYGNNGVFNTINKCRSYGLDYVGGGENITDAARTLSISIDGKRIAIINCCEIEFSIASLNRAGANPFDLINVYASIQKAKEETDYIIVIVHGGIEGYQYPTTRMVKQYRFLVDCGADVVINHHQHCYSGYEEYKGKLICYGLGNLCFDRGKDYNSLWQEGYCVELVVASNGLDYVIHPYIQSRLSPTISKLSDDSRVEFDDKIKCINEIINNNELLEKHNDTFIKSNSYPFALMLTPYEGRITQGLFRRGLLPKLFSERKYADLMSSITCESNRERLLSYLSEQKKKYND